MPRLLFLVVGVLLGTLSHSSLAQEDASSQDQWEIGIQALRVNVASRAGTEVGVRTARRLGEQWGLEASAHHVFSEASPLKDGFGARYDRRRVGASVTVFWEPLRFRTGSFRHAIRLHAGPMVQARRITRKGKVALFCTVGLSKDIDSHIERRFPEQTQHVGVGAEFGLGYGVTYGPVTTRAVAVIRDLRFGRAPSYGAATWERRSPGVGMTLNVRF